jgi:GTP-binding protein
VAHGGEALNGARPRPPSDDAATEAERLEQGRRLFAAECLFVAGAAAAGQIPAVSLPEIAFAGRSNVGKSSLVNRLTGRKALARISDTPGRTRQINFFVLGGRLMLVDLPGYGYARASKDQVASWTLLVRDYLRGRPTLRRVCLLVDGRHGLKESDEAMMDMMDRAAVSYQIVLTKADKLTPEEVRVKQVETGAAVARRTAAHPEVVATSAHSGAGVPELRAGLADLAADAPAAAAEGGPER